MLDKLLTRGLRQLRLKVRFRPKVEDSVIIDRVAIRKKVQSLHEIEEEPVEWGVGSKFHLEAFSQFSLEESQSPLSSKCAIASDSNLDTIIKFIEDSSAAEDLKIYTSSDVTQVILSLSSVPARRALLQSILKSFKPLFPKRCISVDGDADKKAEWLVIDLKRTIVHIFDPRIRLEIDLDGKLESEIGMKPESQAEFLHKFTNSLPRAIASRPNLIEKFRLKTKQQ